MTSNDVFFEVEKKKHCREERDKKSHYQVLTEADFQKIKHSQTVNPNTPEGAMNTVWFDV